MTLFSRIALSLGVFVLVTGVIYGKAGYEYEGTTLMITMAGGALLVGAYLISAVRRARRILAGGHPEEAAGADSEPHVAPTIWPLVFALSTIGLIVGAIAARWALVAGGLLLAVACTGWVLDVRRQWSHHAAAVHHEAGPEVRRDGPKGPATE